MDKDELNKIHKRNKVTDAMWDMENLIAPLVLGSLLLVMVLKIIGIL